LCIFELIQRHKLAEKFTISSKTTYTPTQLLITQAATRAQEAKLNQLRDINELTTRILHKAKG